MLYSNQALCNALDDTYTQSAAEVMRRFKSRLNEVRSKIDEAYDGDTRSTSNAWRDLADERGGSSFFGGVLERDQDVRRQRDSEQRDRERDNERQRDREREERRRKEESTRKEKEAPPGEPWNRPTSPPRDEGRLGDWESALRWADEDTKDRNDVQRRREEDRARDDARRARDEEQERRWREQQRRLLDEADDGEMPSKARRRDEEEDDAIAKEIEEAEQRAAAVAAALDKWERRKAADKVWVLS